MFETIGDACADRRGVQRPPPGSHRDHHRRSRHVRCRDAFPPPREEKLRSGIDLGFVLYGIGMELPRAQSMSIFSRGARISGGRPGPGSRWTAGTFPHKGEQ